MALFWIELAGWLGVFFYLLAYLLLTLRLVRADRLPFHLLNVLGAIGLIINSMHTHDHQSIVVNVAWLLIGLWAICRNYRPVQRF
ncbi:CBU_0592 family membrane protein [Larkinella sp. VNQ87]|uniref:CBU_0592 family membrane protein n=1 Tax=Larkinella sp. VNQ87 TaxID=3400921 RepID=UPI003C097ECC